MDFSNGTHSSTLAWKIPWTEEPDRLQSLGSLRAGHDSVTSLSLSLSCTGEGNGNPLQCSCLENPRDGGAWWAAVCGVTQSRTWLKQLSSYHLKIFCLDHNNSLCIEGECWVLGQSWSICLLRKFSGVLHSFRKFVINTSVKLLYVVVYCFFYNVFIRPIFRMCGFFLDVVLGSWCAFVTCIHLCTKWRHF